jgi:hypothetical protein
MSETKNCLFCGAEIPSIAKMCRQCLKRVEDSPSNEPAPSTNSTDTEKEPQKPLTKKKMTRGQIAALMSIIAVIAIVANVALTNNDKIEEDRLTIKYYDCESLVPQIKWNLSEELLEISVQNNDKFTNCIESFSISVVARDKDDNVIMGDSHIINKFCSGSSVTENFDKFYTIRGKIEKYQIGLHCL